LEEEKMDTKEQQIRLLYYWLEKERRKRIVRLLLSEILVLAGIGIVLLGGSGSALLGSASFAGLILLFYLLVADPPMSAERMERVSSAIQQGKFASQNAFPTKWGPPPRLVWWAYRMLYKAETPLLEGKVFSSTTLQQLNGANEVDAEEMSYNEANEALFVYGMQLIGHPETGYSVYHKMFGRWYKVASLWTRADQTRDLHYKNNVSHRTQVRSVPGFLFRFDDGSELQVMPGDNLSLVRVTAK